MITPHNNDVLFGRGSTIMGHPGNERLRSMVERHRKSFVEAVKRKEKRKIATDIIEEIQSLQPPGRFLTKDPQGKLGKDSHNEGHAYIASDGVQTSILNGAWVCVDPDKALVKVMHGLREKGTGCGSGGGCQIEMQKQQERLAEQEQTVKQSVGSWQADGTGDLDEELDSFLRAFTSQHDKDAIEVRELTMQDWIDQSKRTRGKPFKKKSEYIRSALSIALKLTEFLIEAESGSGNSIPLASIVAGNVLIRAKVFHSIEGYQDIEYAWIMSCIGDNPETGGIMPRLVALGVLLYELFSGGEVLTLEQDVSSPNATSNMMSLNSIKLNNESNGSDHPKKKAQRHRVSADVISECIGKIELIGVPRSLCALLKHILDCSNGDFCGDTAFTSYADVQLDLQLMVTDPSRFLDDIHTHPMPSLKIRNKLYGREEEIEQVETSYQQLPDGTCNGIIISGGAGVGKSNLAMHVGELTSQAGGYFVRAKYEQNNHVIPLSATGFVFNTLCDLFARDATPSQLMSVGEALGSALGSQAALLTSALPSLAKLMPSNLGSESSTGCVDFELSLRFLFTQVLGAISSHSRSISLFFDDIQWADSASLTLIASLMYSVEGSRSVFFTCCYRDNDVGEDSPFKNWVSSIRGTSLTTIKLENMAEVDVNNLVSDTLHISPRLTRPLSSVLYHKTRGNILFLRQLIESLKDQGHIYFKLSQARWAWDLNKVMDLQLPDGVVPMLINEMQRLPPNLQMSLKVASCMGSCVKYSILDILSRELDLDLHIVLQQISKKGFMHNDSAVSSFRWVHDKIEQSAAELMSEQERREIHMRLGLAISSFHSSFKGSDDDPGIDEILFAAVNQINCGGLGALSDPSKRGEIASLNLKAGKRVVVFSDFNAALKLFEHGASFLPHDSWVTHYDLSIDLFEAAAEAACITNNSRAVISYANQLIANAKCFDDKLSCLFSLAKSLRQANRLKESMDSFLSIIQQCGEKLPLPMDSGKLNNEMEVMNQTLQSISDESILNMGETNNKKVIVLLKIYAELATMLVFIEPSLIGAVSLRMVDLTLRYGLTSVSPCAFAVYGGILVSKGDELVTEACRLAKTALKLLERSASSVYKSNVICTVNVLVLWASDPLQVIAKAHLEGYRAGMQTGDCLHAVMNEVMILWDHYFTGQSLTIVRKQLRDFILKMQRENIQFVRGSTLVYHLQAVVLQDGNVCLHDQCVDGLPGLRKITVERDEVAKNGGKRDTTVSLLINNFHVQRALLFRQFDDISFDNNNLSDVISEEKHPLRPIILMGFFFEGLVSFQLARQTRNEARTRWIEKGISTLAKMQCWTNHCRWNFENKMLLLEAEKMYMLGQFDQAAELYIRSIRSAHDHKFIHEVAIASEYAGDLFYERHVLPKSVALYKYSIKCYKEWGAFAVARRVENAVQTKTKGLDIAQLDSVDESLAFIFTSQQVSSKKRLGI